MAALDAAPAAPYVAEVRTETKPQRSPGPPLLIGEAPPPGGLGPLGPFDCASGDNLARILTDGATALGAPRAWDRPAALAAFDRRNVLAAWPGKASKGSRFPRADARRGAHLLMEQIPRGARIILAGSRVADAFGLALPLGAWARSHGAHWTVIPHPSGATRAYNLAATREAAGMVLLRALDLCAAEQRAEVRVGPSAWYHYGRGQFRGNLAVARAMLADATTRVFRWCATSHVSVRAHEALTAWRAYRRCLARLHTTRVAVRSAAIALIHDRHEPLAGDLASPVKPLLREDWRPIEQAAAAAVADLYAGDAPEGSPLRPLAPADEHAAQVQAHAADLDAAALEAAWWHPDASERALEDPLCHAARAAHVPVTGMDDFPLGLVVLEVAAADLDDAAWSPGYDSLQAALERLSAHLPALPCPGEGVALAR